MVFTKKVFLFLVFWLSCVWSFSQEVMDVDYTTIIEDIYEQLAEDGQALSLEEVEEALEELHNNPINLNNTSWEELRQLPFLSDEQIDEMMLYINKQPLQEVYELQLIPTLKEWDIRNLLPFVVVGEGKSADSLRWRDVLRGSKHEIVTRVDARNVEDFEGDPVYANVRYKYNFRKKVFFGFQTKRLVGQEWKDVSYGGYVQLRDIWKFKDIVAGNFQGTFGQGLVLSSPIHVGKVSYLSSCHINGEGLKKFSSIGDYDYLHGIGATLKFSHLEISALYSNREDKVRRQVFGANVTYRGERWQVGITAIEKLYSDSLTMRNNYYNRNYFRGDQQAVAGANFRANFNRCMIFGEITAAQNTQWGYAGLIGTRYTPLSDLTLLALYRYYTTDFDNTLGYAFSETSRVNDENGLYLGAEIKMLKKWKFATYLDGFRFAQPKYLIRDYPTYGYDAVLETNYYLRRTMNMYLKMRANLKGEMGTYSFRYQYNVRVAQWTLRTQLDGNIVTSDERTYGASIIQNVTYSCANVPFIVQLRAQAFNAQKWNNRIYNYENDVLYAFSIPATYGLGARWYANLTYKPCTWCNLYLRASQTIYAKKWMDEKKYNRTKTDFHLLARFKI